GPGVDDGDDRSAVPVVEPVAHLHEAGAVAEAAQIIDVEPARRAKPGHGGVVRICRRWLWSAYHRRWAFAAQAIDDARVRNPVPDGAGISCLTSRASVRAGAAMRP